MTPPPRRLSGLQRQVLTLYRASLRAAAALPDAPSRAAAAEFARSSFRANVSVDKLDFQRVEFLLRQGRKKLDMVSAADVSGFHLR